MRLAARPEHHINIQSSSSVSSSLISNLQIPTLLPRYSTEMLLKKTAPHTNAKANFLKISPPFSFSSWIFPSLETQEEVAKIENIHFKEATD